MHDDNLKEKVALLIPELCAVETHGDQKHLVWTDTRLELGIQKDCSVFPIHMLGICDLIEKRLTNEQLEQYETTLQITCRTKFRLRGETYPCASRASWQERIGVLYSILQ